MIEGEDRLVIFLPRKRMVRDVEKLFQVSATYF
jgi:trk system potassium uptake protein